MSYYYETPANQTSSSAVKIIGIIVILMIVIASGIAMLFQFDPQIAPPGVDGDVKVAVIDSGLDVDFTIESRVAEQKSFVEPRYGYDVTDLTTTDSNPSDDAGGTVPHGTIVSRTVLQTSSNAIIVNAKVIDSDGGATASGIIAAIYWAIEQNCSVINLSLGSSPTYGDPIEQAIEYAFSMGVLVVSAAGNDGAGGIGGTSINSPSVFLYSLSVGASNDDGEPASFTSIGPTADRYMKPDIIAQGYSEYGSSIYFGTSFASPRAAAVAAGLVAYCNANDITVSPGLLMAAIMKGASSLPYPEYVIGSGVLDYTGARDAIIESTQVDNDPEIVYVSPGSLPLDFERLFYGDSYKFNLRLVTAGYSTYSIVIDSQTPEIFDIANQVSVNQTALIPITINVPETGPVSFGATITFEAAGHDIATTVSFFADEAIARIAFDTSHTTWPIDTSYGQFKELYIKLVSNDISVTEIQDSSLISSSYLDQFDAVFLLDPCAWDINETDPTNLHLISFPYSEQETLAYEEYFLNGGGIFVTALSNDSLDISSLNEFLDWTGFSLGYQSVPSSGSPVLIDDLYAHAITAGVQDFDFVGASVRHNASGFTLARYGITSVLACMEGSGGGRIVVTGTNFFIDNWGILGEYSSSDNDILSLKIALWLSQLS
ncbi:MAG: S8 family peptidase [Candidatus Thorarchaeota archaeon]